MHGMASLLLHVTHQDRARAFSAVAVLICISPVATLSPTIAGPGHAQYHHPSSAGLDRFQKGMIIGFVTFAVLALCMMLLILYFLVKGTRRELKRAQVELAELREQRRQETAAERLRTRARDSELRCIVDEELAEEEEEEEGGDQDSLELVLNEKRRDYDQDGGYDEFKTPPSPGYDNYTYVTMESCTKKGRHGRKKQKPNANDDVIEK